MPALDSRASRDCDRYRSVPPGTCLPHSFNRATGNGMIAGLGVAVAIAVALGLALAVAGGVSVARAQGGPPASPARMADAMGACLPIQAVRPAANRPDAVLVDVQNDPELIYIPFVDPRAPDLLRWVVDATPPGDGLGQAITLTLQRAEGGDYPRVQHPGDPGLQLVLPSYPTPPFVPTEAAMRTVEDVSARATACFTSLPLP